MNLESVAQYLESQAIGDRGKTIFVRSMPYECEQGILLRDPYGGSPIDWELPGYRKAEFALIVRAKTFQDGNDLMKRSLAALTIHSDTNLDHMLVRFIRPRHDPVSYPISEGNNVEISVNFDAVYIVL